MLPGPGARRQPKRRPPSGWVIVVFVQICLFFYMYWQLRPNEQAATSFSEVQKPGEAEEPQRSSVELAEVVHEAKVSDPSVLKTLAVNPWVFSSEQTRMGGIRIAFPTTGEPKVVMQTPAMEQPLSEEQARKPFFSIVLAAYNQGAFLEETVGSVLAQTYSDWELIIVDDGSTDSTWPLASSLLDRHAGFRIRLLRKDNGGLADARNAGLRYARGSWLCMLDSDDLLGRSYLQEAAAFAQEDARVDIVPGCMRNFDAVTGDWCFPEGWSVVGVSHWNKFHASVVMRRRLLEATGGYDPGLPWGLEDWNFWLSTIPHGPVVRFSATLTFHYRQHTGSSMRKEMFACCLEEVKAMVRTNHPELYEPQQLLQDHATIAAMRADTLQRLEAKLRVFPGLPKPFFWRALRLAAQGQVDDAIRDLETAVRLSQDSAAPQEMLSWQMHYHLALAHRSQGNLAAALHSVNQALKSAYFDDVLHLKQQLEQQVLGAEPREGRMALVPQYWQSEEARQHVLDGTVTSQLAQLAQLRASSQAASAQHRLLLTVLTMTQSQPCTRGRRLGDGVNMLQDGAFEGRGAWGKFGAGFQLVQTAGRPGGSGVTVLKLENGDEEQQRGAAQIVAVDQHEPAPLLIQAWSKADAVSGVAGSGYALYLDVTYADGSHEWSVTLQFDTGSHDWQHRQLLLQRDLPIRQLNVHCLLRGHAGTVWFDDVSIAALDQAVCRCALGQVFRPGGAGDCDQCPGGQMCVMGLVFDSPEPVRAGQGS